MNWEVTDRSKDGIPLHAPEKRLKPRLLTAPGGENKKRNPAFKVNKQICHRAPADYYRLFNNSNLLAHWLLNLRP